MIINRLHKKQFIPRGEILSFSLLACPFADYYLSESHAFFSFISSVPPNAAEIPLALVLVGRADKKGAANALFRLQTAFFKVAKTVPLCRNLSVPILQA
jgi:hypothetical protein